MWLENHPEDAFENPEAAKTVDAFNRVTSGETRCDKICGKCFKMVDEHTEFITNGGCKKIIDALAEA